MKNTAQGLRTHLYILIGLTGLTLSLQAQRKEAITVPEAELARLLLSDTISNTVSYLPKGYWFGMQDRSHGYLVLIKHRAKNYLLRDGTHQVHLLVSDNTGYRLERLDSSVFSGDNFLMMAFLRKDTIYQYGGYGFWNTRDFFMRYRATNRDWDFVTGGYGLQNELNYHYYDQLSDAFYVVGSLSTTHHPVPKKKLLDSVYRYDFPLRRWSALGRIREDFNDLDSRWNNEMALCFTPFGLLDCRTSGLKLYDIPRNRILSAFNRLEDLTFSIGRSDRLFTLDYRHFIYLKDTLHVFQGTKDSVRHARIQMSMDDFNPKLVQHLYDPLDKGSTPWMKESGLWLLALGIPFVAAAGYLIRGRKRFSPGVDPALDHDVTDDPPLISPPAQIEDQDPFTLPPTPLSDMVFFKTQLSPAEQALLTLLLECTIAGRSTDIQTINKTLGVSSKDPSLQKARRSLAIGNINSNFRQTLKQDVMLIIRDRDVEDKRAFVYRIDEQYISLIKD